MSQRGTRGRGAIRNVKGRFDRYETVPIEDDSSSPHSDEDATSRQPLRTTLTAEKSRSIITTNDSPDVPFDQSANPYRGCEHGCIYCFARPSHAYLNLSPGLDFETRILFKPAAAELLRRAFSKKSYRCRVLALGSNTDPYQPAERKLRLTRGILEVLAEHRHPVSIVTKSQLVTRDLDLLAPMARDNLASVYFSITTRDPELARSMEPRASTPERRLEALAAVVGAGVPAGVLPSPVIPGLNDFELERILEEAARAGATSASYMLLRLPHEVKQLFTEWIRTRYPAKAERTLSRLRDMRRGRLYDPAFEVRHTGEGPHADLLRRRFEIASRRLGLNVERPQLDCSKFRRPANRSTGSGSQLNLFG